MRERKASMDASSKSSAFADIRGTNARLIAHAAFLALNPCAPLKRRVATPLFRNPVVGTAERTRQRTQSHADKPSMVLLQQLPSGTFDLNEETATKCTTRWLSTVLHRGCEGRKVYEVWEAG
mmetsp:Transcript_48748/g.74171  ORF Transcript_48748/g.74171 Transcript_48748/m.74171 type:complete len:122 (+) Transcript_48748:511-876(+)